MGFINSLLVTLHSLLAGIIILAHIVMGGFNAELSYSPASAPPSQATPTAPFATTTQKTTSTPAKKSVIASLPISKPIKQVIKESPATSPALPIPTKNQEEVNTEARQALVNILCAAKPGAPMSSISGSGVFVDSRGVILTNAHVGQFLLLKDYPLPDSMVCTIRTGSPAQATYIARLLYLPPRWISANASQINEQHATGTGEDDYAFLLVTGPATPFITMPAQFPSLPMTLDMPDNGEGLLLAAYPASFLDGVTIQQDLYILSAVTQVTQLFTFDNPAHIDAISIGSTVVSQNGSSGGAVVRLSDSNLVGIISTATAGTTTAERILNAITMGHIDRSLKIDGEGGILSLLSHNLTTYADAFNKDVAPMLGKKLIDALQKH